MSDAGKASWSETSKPAVQPTLSKVRVSRTEPTPGRLRALVASPWTAVALLATGSSLLARVNPLEAAETILVVGSILVLGVVALVALWRERGVAPAMFLAMLPLMGLGPGVNWSPDLALLLVLAALVALLREVSLDGYGHRPPPPSHHDD